MSGSSKQHLSFMSSHQNAVCIASVPHTATLPPSYYVDVLMPLSVMVWIHTLSLRSSSVICDTDTVEIRHVFVIRAFISLCVKVELDISKVNISRILITELKLECNRL